MFDGHSWSNYDGTRIVLFDAVTELYSGKSSFLLTDLLCSCNNIHKNKDPNLTMFHGHTWSACLSLTKFDCQTWSRYFLSDFFLISVKLQGQDATH